MSDAGKKRNLPSWISNSNSSSRPSKEPAGPTTSDLSKLLEGVVFVLSGFVNPERAKLRSEAVAMGAEYRPDWGPDCTLLVCAYRNTPKFRQVEGDCGTVVSRDWISECYAQRKVVEIDEYLMHAGKPWRKGHVDREGEGEAGKDLNVSPPRKHSKQVERGSHRKAAASSSLKKSPSAPSEENFSPSKVKEWAIDDLNRTVSWLENQEEKPESSEIKQIAAEGVLLCLQDAIDCIEQNQDFSQIAEQWNVVPRAVKELIKVVEGKTAAASFSKEDITRQAKEYKQIYQAELSSFCKSKEIGETESNAANTKLDDEAGYDSDETIEMTEEEIDLAFNSVASKICI